MNLLFVVCILLVLAIVITAVAHIWVAVPFIPTPRKVVPQMLDFAGLKGDETVFDMGAGDGRLLIAAKRRYPGITAVGSEVVPTIWLLGKIRIALSRQAVEWKLQNVLHQDVSQADCIFLYLIPSLMQKLKVKFDRELKPGTKVVSYAFSFRDKEPVKEQSVPWLTEERKLRMYVW